MNPVARALAAAAKTSAQVNGVDIEYRRDDQALPLRAVPGITRYPLTDVDGTQIVAQSRDYLIVACELDFGDGPTEPAEGDLVIETLADGEHAYAVAQIPGEAAWRWSDEHRVRYRVHTKEVALPE